MQILFTRDQGNETNKDENGKITKNVGKLFNNDNEEITKNEGK